MAGEDKRFVYLFTSEAAAKQPWFKMVVHLHYDILCVVVQFLENDRRALFNCSLVNKEFNFVASQILYRTVVVNSKSSIVSSSS